jgi:hypothetical protein
MAGVGRIPLNPLRRSVHRGLTRRSFLNPTSQAQRDSFRIARAIHLTPPTSIPNQQSKQDTSLIANLLSRVQCFHESTQLIFDGVIRILGFLKRRFGFLLIRQAILLQFL